MLQQIYVAMGCLVTVAIAHAQTHGFKEYQDSYRKMDVTVKAPEGMRYNDNSAYSAENDYQTYTIDVNPDFCTLSCGHKMPNIGWIYGAAFEGDGAVMLFPTQFSYMPQLDSWVELEIQASHSDQNLDVRPYLSVIAQKDMSKYANADTVLVYQFDILGKPFMDKYSHVIGVYLRKYAHPSIGLKIVTDDKGLTKKDEYVKLMLDCIKYGDEVHDEGVKWEKEYPGKITILDKSPSIHTN